MDMKPALLPQNQTSVPPQPTPAPRTAPRHPARWWVALGLTALANLLAPLATQAQVYSATNIWTGAGGDPFWLTLGNWTNNSLPTPTSWVVFTNYGTTGLPGTNGSGAVGTANVIISNDTQIASLSINNTNGAGATAGFHTLTISNGVTLTISNSVALGQTNILQVTSQSGAAGNFGVDNGKDNPIYATIQGAGGTLLVIATNGLGAIYNRGNIFINQGSLGGPFLSDLINATLDLSGLDNFVAQVNHLCVGADSGPAPFFYNRPRGTLYLARTNHLTLWAVGNHPSANLVTHGILAGMMAQNNGGPGRGGYIYLGQTNAIFCNTGIGLGIRASSGYMGFNPSNAPGTSVAYFRDRAGTGRQSVWAIGNRMNATTANNISGQMDFSLGTVDALVGTLGIGVSPVANTVTGAVSFGSGTIDVNVLQCGYQSVSGAGGAQGTLSVSNTAILKVNTSGILGGTTGNLVGGNVYFGRLYITDGGQVLFANTAPLTTGAGSTSEIKLLNGSQLQVLSLGTPSVPLTSLQISNSTLTVDRGILSNPLFAPVVVDTIDAAATNTVNVLGTVLVAGRFPLIKYTTFANGGFTNFVLGSTSPGVTAYLTNNLANSTIDVVVTSSLTSVLTWNGRTNAVDVGVWEINSPTNWKGGLAYSQASVPGSLVRFDDSADGTTDVVLNNANLAPADILITNATKVYTFGGAGGLVGPTALTKDGDALFVLANSGSNGFTGGVLLNKGTLQLGGSANRLPTNTLVTIADAAATVLDLNGLDQTIAAISGGGAFGGDVSLGTGNLTIRGGSGNYAGVISGAGALIKQTAGTQILAGPNSYAGGTVISNSAVQLLNSSGSGLGSGPVLIGAGGTLQIGNGAADGYVSAAFLTNNGTLSLYPAGSVTLTNVLVGAGNLVKVIGNGTTLYVTNANYHTGGSAVQQGLLQISHPNALGTGTIIVGNATATDTELALSGNITLTNAITLSGKTGALVPSPVGLNNVLDVVTGEPGTNHVTGPITITGSTCWSVGSDAGKLVVSGNFINSQAGALCQFFLRGSAEGVWGSVLKDASAALRLTLDKNDPGTWTLTATNTFTGRTVLNAGKLVVNGALAGSSNVVVLAATLAGTGFISGAVTNSGTIDLSGDGMLAPLTISNALFLDFGTTTAFDVSTNGNDSIRGLTTVVYDGTLKVVLPGSLTGNAIFKLFDATNYLGSFAGYELPDIFPMTWDTTQLPVDGTLRATGGPSVTPAITGISNGGANGLFLSGTGTLVAPYTILASTNVALPLVDWVNLGGGTFSNGLFLFNDRSATNYAQRFYLLATPAP